MNTFLSVMAILIPLALMIILIWKKVHMVIIAPLCACLMAVLSGLPVMESLTGAYMSAFAGYVQSYFLLIILGALFSKLMEASGASKDVAEYEKLEPGNGWLGLVPLVVVIGLLLFKVNVLIALGSGILVIFAMYWKKITDKLGTLSAG